MEEYVLIASSTGMQGEVIDFLRTLPRVDLVRPVNLGHFDVLVRVTGRTHHEIQEVLANKIRFHAGVERVDEIGDAEEAAPTLHALDVAGEA